MIPIEAQDTTRHIGEPANWDEEKFGPCMTLPVADVQMGEANYMVSTWMFTGDELVEVLRQYEAGEPVRVRFAVMGHVHPVIRAWVE